MTTLSQKLARLDELQNSHRSVDVTIEDLRGAIDVVDSVLVELINRRGEIATAIGEIKKRDDLPVYVPSREKIVIAGVVSKSEGPLPDESIRRIFERIIDETRNMVRHFIAEE